jgi:hypothetical protein
MNAFMLPQLARRVKRFLAKIAFLLLYSSVPRLVDIQSRQCPKSFTTFVTSVCDLTSVDLYVRVQRVGSGKLETAITAFVFLLAGMRSQVTLHVSFLGEGAPTFWTLEWLFSSMSQQVRFKIPTLTEAFPTSRTHEWFFTAMYPRVQF